MFFNYHWFDSLDHKLLCTPMIKIIINNIVKFIIILYYYNFCDAQNRWFYICVIFLSFFLENKMIGVKTPNYCPTLTNLIVKHMMI